MGSWRERWRQAREWLAGDDADGCLLTSAERRQRRRVRRVLLGLSGCYFLGVSLVLAGMSLLSGWLTICYLLLFVPVVVWLFPLVPLLAASALRHRRLALVQLAFAALVLGGYMGCHVGLGWGSTGPRLRLVTCNIGQRSGHSVLPFLVSQEPDLILFQETSFEVQDIERELSTYQTNQTAQFVLLSRWPIVQATPVMVPAHPESPVAARYELDWNGRRLALYNVHLPTPRDCLVELRKHRRDAFRSCRQFLQRQVRVVAELNAQLAQEKLPLLMGGDFNQPAIGPLYRRLAAGRRDAHASRGWGYGYTAPGTAARWWARPFVPHMRLDYLFAGRDFTAQSCQPEWSAEGQHLAVAAEWAWTGPAAGR